VDNAPSRGFGIAEIPEDGYLQPKHVVNGRTDSNYCIVDGIILCMKVTILHHLEKSLL
jgi:hypothetical protein